MTRKSFLTIIGAVAWGLFLIALIVSAIIAAGKCVDGGITNPTFIAPAANNGTRPSRA